MTIFDLLYPGVPLWARILFGIALVIAILSFISIVVLVVVARRFRREMRRRRDAEDTLTADDFLWIFLVPALNEEVTISDSVSRLQQVKAARTVIYVIDDGSEDATAEILARIDDRRLRVLTRVPPDARTGKADALNAAYRDIDVLLTQPEFDGVTRDRVIVGMVDADGRLDPDAPAGVAAHFSDPRVGGVQVRVRIYNRRGWLTWAQDVEFATFGYIFQAGRAAWGTANMGGNGQFNRLSALDTVEVTVPEEPEEPTRDAATETSRPPVHAGGPWRHRLTEDQDLGVRLLHEQWAGEHDNDVTIEQQGLNSLRRLYRQRVRWAQGNWQSLSLLGGVGGIRTSLAGRIDAVWYLLTPPLQLIMGIAFAVSIVFSLLSLASYQPPYLITFVFFLSLGFGAGVVALTIIGGKWYSIFTALLLVIPYTIYSWMIFPVLFASLVRQLAGRKSWTKTAREPIDEETTDAASPVPPPG